MSVSGLRVAHTAVSLCSSCANVACFGGAAGRTTVAKRTKTVKRLIRSANTKPALVAAARIPRLMSGRPVRKTFTPNNGTDAPHLRKSPENPPFEEFDFAKPQTGTTVL